MSAFATLSLTASTAFGGVIARMSSQILGGATMMTMTTTIPMAGEF